jgi:hypothetical protein
MTGYTFSESVVNQLQPLRAEASHRARKLRNEADEASRIGKVWDDLATFIARGWPLHVLHLFESERPLLNRIKNDNKAAGILDELYQAANEMASRALQQFPVDIERACSEKNIPLDLDSRHPRYTFEHGFFMLEVQEQKLLARLSDLEGDLDQLPPDVEAVTIAVQREDKRVFGRPFDGAKFLKKLRHHYLAVLKKESQSDGASLPLRRITARLGKNEKGFRTDEFLVDLSRLVDKGPLEIDGVRLDLQQTKDTHQGMLLHGLAGGGYVGFVTFKKV